jgi:tetratricopeptide (TPR) repeat protein
MKLRHLLLGLLVFSCTPNVPPVELSEYQSLSGEQLPKKQIPEETRKDFEQKLSEAKTRLDQHPDSLELIIWYGRRLAYLGQFNEAIQVFTEGLKKHPRSHHLRRHRGHRYITTRQFDLAVADFELAEFFSWGKPNEIEPDGLPNTKNIPLGNDQFNIWYHLGLASYLKGDYRIALLAYNKCMEVSDNNDLLVATTYWMYMAQHRLGFRDEAAILLEKITPEMELIENRDYLDLLLLFKGVKSENQLLSTAKGKDGNWLPTLAYGIGNWYLQNGEKEKADKMFREILKSPQWDAFGYIAAEAELY